VAQKFTPFSKKKVRPQKLTDLMTPGLNKRGPKPKYHTPDAVKAKGVMAGTARPSFDTDSSGHCISDSDDGDDLIPDLKTVELSETEISSSDFDTDFSADDLPTVQQVPVKSPPKPKSKPKSPQKSAKPALKLKIKLPPQPDRLKPLTPVMSPASTPLTSSSKSSKKRKRASNGQAEDDSKPMSKKLKQGLAGLNTPNKVMNGNKTKLDVPVQRVARLDMLSVPPGSGSENEKLYCICRAPHDEVSEMIGCDGPDCKVEWFHFECVGIMVPPVGKWYCPQCSLRYGL